MSPAVYLPPDAFGGREPPDLDLAADYLELGAVFSGDGQSFSADIVDALELAAEAEAGSDDVDAEMRNREEVAAGAVARMSSRKRILSAAYPFDLDDRGDAVFFTAERPDPGQAAYLVVNEATVLAGNGMTIEAIDRLEVAKGWIRSYVERVRTA